MSPRLLSLEARVEALHGILPSIAWRWDPETDILSGAFREDAPDDGGFCGMVELTDDKGSVIVLDFGRGMLSGLDVVVWPPVESDNGLIPPPTGSDARVILPRRAPQRGPESREVETALRVTANPRQTIFHIQVGQEPRARAVRVANRFLVELDDAGRLAGFWLLDVEAFPLELEPLDDE